MKILLAGPIPNTKSSGGVAVFDKALVDQLRQEGHDVKILTKSKNNEDETISIGINQFGAIKKFQPDLIISSLWYSLFFLHNKVKKIHLVHGFTNLSNYNFFKFFTMIIFDKIIYRKFDFILSNSEFTKLINKEIFGLESNGIFNIGLNSNISFKENILKTENTEHKKTFLYVGRLVKAKNVDLIIKSFKELTNKNFELQIIGYGNEEANLKKIAKDDARIKFIGQINNEQLDTYYWNADVFISLNPVEPYGITFLEAAARGTFIIAPSTGGQLDILKYYPNQYELVDVWKKMEIINAMINSPKRKLVTWNLQVTMKKTVKEILSYVE